MKRFKYLLLLPLLLILMYVPIKAASVTVTKGLIGKQDVSLWNGTTTTKTFTRSTSTDYTLTLNQIDWPGVDILQLYGGGVNRTRATIAAALTAIGTSSESALWLSPGTWTITSDLDASAYTKVQFVLAPGAKIQPSAGATFTVYSPGNITASPTQQWVITTGNTTDPVVFSNAGVVHPGWWYNSEWGDTISDAIASIRTAGGEVHFSTNMTITTPINATSITSGIVFSGAGGGTTVGPRITGTLAGVMFDCTGSRYLTFKDFTINGSSTTEPSTAFLLARESVGSSAGEHTFENIVKSA